MSDEVQSDGFEGGVVPPSNWMKWSNVGDSIKGTLVDKRLKPGSSGFEDQWVYELTKVSVNGKPAEGNWFATVKASNNFILSRIKHVKLGEIIGFKFEATIPAKVKGYNDAKSIKPYLFGPDTEWDAMQSMGGQEIDPATMPEFNK